jgi:hypothetical protein
MKFGFLTFLLLFIVLAIAGISAFLIFTDVPVVQKEIIIDIPADTATSPQ